MSRNIKCMADWSKEDLLINISTILCGGLILWGCLGGPQTVLYPYNVKLSDVPIWMPEERGKLFFWRKCTLLYSRKKFDTPTHILRNEFCLLCNQFPGTKRKIWSLGVHDPEGEVILGGEGVGIRDTQIILTKNLWCYFWVTPIPIFGVTTEHFRSGICKWCKCLFVLWNNARLHVGILQKYALLEDKTKKIKKKLSKKIIQEF